MIYDLILVVLFLILLSSIVNMIRTLYLIKIGKYDL